MRNFKIGYDIAGIYQNRLLLETMSERMKPMHSIGGEGRYEG